MTMGKKSAAPTLNHDFEFLKDADLHAQIAAFAAAHEGAHEQLLAMDGADRSDQGRCG